MGVEYFSENWKELKFMILRQYVVDGEECSRLKISGNHLVAVAVV